MSKWEIVLKPITRFFFHFANRRKCFTLDFKVKYRMQHKKKVVQLGKFIFFLVRNARKRHHAWLLLVSRVAL